MICPVELASEVSAWKAAWGKTPEGVADFAVQAGPHRGYPCGPFFLVPLGSGGGITSRQGRRGQMLPAGKGKQFGFFFRQDKGAFDDVLQLANIAGPGMSLQRAARLPGKDFARPAGLPAQRGEEMPGQRHDIRQPLPQRRQLNRKNREPVVQVLAKLARRHARGQVRVGRRNHPHVHMRGPRCPAAAVPPPGESAAAWPAC